MPGLDTQHEVLHGQSRNFMHERDMAYLYSLAVAGLLPILGHYYHASFHSPGKMFSTFS